MILEGLFKPKATYAPIDDFWYNPVGEGVAMMSRGYSLSADSALTISAVYSAVRILAETLASVPLKVYRNIDNGGKEPAETLPLYSILHDSPNQIQTSFEWREMSMGHLALRGNCYSKILQGPAGFVDQLIPLSPDRMRVTKLSNARVGYVYREDDGRQETYTQDEIFHVRGLSNDGVTGLSPISIMRESLGLTNALEAYGAKLFKDGALHRGILKHPGHLTDEAIKHLKESIKQEHGGTANAHGTMILEEGMSWEKVGMTSEDAQFLLSRKFQISEIARWFRIPPHLLGDLEKATFSNIEQQELEFVVLSMVPWFVRWEQRILKDLILQPNKFKAEFVVDGLVRGDIAARYTAYKSAIETGWMTRNEARIKENLNQETGLDRFLIQQNMAEVDKNGRVIPANKPNVDPNQQPSNLPSQNGNQAASEEDEYFRRLLSASAERVARKEAHAVTQAIKRKADSPAKLKQWAEGFYVDMAKFFADVMCVEQEKAEEFAEQQKDSLLLSAKDNCLEGFVKDLESNGQGRVLEFLKMQRNGHKAAA